MYHVEGGMLVEDGIFVVNLGKLMRSFLTEVLRARWTTGRPSDRPSACEGLRDRLKSDSIAIIMDGSSGISGQGCSTLWYARSGLGGRDMATDVRGDEI